MAIADPRQVNYRTRVTESVVALSQSGQQIVAPNGDRIGLIFGGNANTLSVSTLPTAVGTFGVPVVPNGAPLLLYMSQFAGLVCQAWFSASGIYPNNVTVIEIIYLPPYESQND